MPTQTFAELHQQLCAERGVRRLSLCDLFDLLQTRRVTPEDGRRLIEHVMSTYGLASMNDITPDARTIERILVTRGGVTGARVVHDLFDDTIRRPDDEEES